MLFSYQIAKKLLVSVRKIELNAVLNIMISIKTCYRKNISTQTALCNCASFNTFFKSMYENFRRNFPHKRLHNPERNDLE